MTPSISHILGLVDPVQGWNSQPGPPDLCKENAASSASPIPQYFLCMKNLERETLKKKKNNEWPGNMLNKHLFLLGEKQQQTLALIKQPFKL